MSNIISTNQAPAAKPVPNSMVLKDYHRILLEAPEYNVPVSGYGNRTRLAPALLEVSSPLIACCTTDTPANIDVVIVRNGTEFPVVRNYSVIPEETLFIPLNGTMLLSGESLMVKASEDDRVSVTISATVGQAEEDNVQ